MTGAGQLQLVPLPEAPDRGEPLFAARIPGQPVRAKHRCQCIGTKPSTRPEDTWKAWRARAVPLVALHWGRRPRIVAPVIAQVTAVFRRPADRRTTYTIDDEVHPYPWPWVDDRVPFVGVPDHDQVWKAALDVCKHARVLADDRLVVGDGGSRRWYAAQGEGPCVEIRLWRAS